MAERIGFALGQPGRYAVAMVFLPKHDAGLRGQCESALAEASEHYGLRPLAWRDVPGDSSDLGDLARQAEPAIRQLFLDGGGLDGEPLEQRLFLARKRAERLVRERLGEPAEDFYISSMSARTITYKGKLFKDRGEVYVDPSGFVVHDGKRWSGGDEGT